MIGIDDFLKVGLLGLFGVVSIGRAEESIFFEEAIAPILKQNCVACHHAKKSEGGLNLESFVAFTKGGDSGPIIDRNEIDKSLLLKRVAGDPESIMPPLDNTVGAKHLSEDQVAFVKRWIQAGAMSKAPAISTPTSESHSLPDQIQTSYAIAITPDSEWIVFSRGNDLVFYPIQDWNQLAVSATRQLVIKDVHRDSCFAIATSPDGLRIATGSSGEVKIWRRRVARLLPMDAETEKSIVSPTATTEVRPSTAASTENKRLTFDGAPISRMTMSKDGSQFATLDDQQRLRMWSAANVDLMQSRPIDHSEAALLLRLEKDVERQKRLIDRWNTKLTELKKIAETSAKSVEEAKKTHETAASEWESKKKELQPLLAVLPELEKSIAQIQAAIEAGKQQSVELTEKQKLEKADVSKLEIAAKGIQALVDLGNQKLAELTAQLEQKKKASADLQSQETAAKAKFDATQQSLKQSEESLRLAIAAVDQKQSQLAPEPKRLESLQSEAARCKKQNEELHSTLIALAFTENGKRLVSINSENQLEVFATPSLQRISPPIPLKGNFNSITTSGDHDLLLRGADKNVQRWSVETVWELECTLDDKVPGIISDRVNALAFNHDGTQISIGSGIGSRTGHLAILELGAVQTTNLQPTTLPVKFNEPELHSDTILGLAYSPDGRSLATCGADKMTKIFDNESMKPIRNLEGHTHHVLGVAWQEDGLNLSTTSGDGTIKVWDSETGESTRTISVGKELTAIGFVGNTTRFVSTAIDNSVRLHEMKSNDSIRQFNAAQNALYAIAVSPDGRFVVATGQEGVPRAWQIEDAKLVHEFK